MFESAIEEDFEIPQQDLQQMDREGEFAASQRKHWYLMGFYQGLKVAHQHEKKEKAKYGK